ncbi:MAG TPA: hypothetical protein VHZ51_19925 [Ktedonobacteraceae bacterium]|nr:hypothetical protein [Ktedonobacteraceae bacterium]
MNDNRPSPSTSSLYADLVPPLPSHLTFPDWQAYEGCLWLNDFEEFSRHWSPRGFDRAHTAVGIWLLSTIAARRVWLPLGSTGEYTPFLHGPGGSHHPLCQDHYGAAGRKVVEPLWARLAALFRHHHAADAH